MEESFKKHFTGVPFQALNKIGNTYEFRTRSNRIYIWC